jgi:hypothetical protein
MTTMNSEQSNVESNQYVQVNYEYAVIDKLAVEMLN